MKRSLRGRIFISLIVVAAILAIGSCSIGHSYIRIANTPGSGFTLIYVSIAAYNSNDWGNELLSPGVIAPGNAQSFEVNPGFYDVWVTDDTPYDIFAHNVQVTAGNTTTLYFDGNTLAE